MNPDLTVVSFLFDLPSRKRLREVNVDKVKQINDYVKLSKFILSLDINLVLYIDSTCVDDVKKIRNDNQLMDKTKIYEMNIEDSPYYKYLDDIDSNLKINPLYNINNKVDTADYFIMTWTKFWIINKVIENNQFNTNKFMWLDFGINHVAKTDIDLQDVFSDISDLVNIHIMRPYNDNELIDLKKYYSNNRGIVAGGIFSGNKDNMKKLCQYFFQELDYCLNNKYSALEEQILPVIVSKNKKLFTYSYGDYCDCLTNFHTITTNYNHILFMLRYGRDHKLHNWNAKICKEIFDNDTSHIPYNIVAKILDEYYISSFYEGNKELSHNIAKKFESMLIQSKQFIEEFNRSKDHYISNFKFSDVDLSKI